MIAMPAVYSNASSADARMGVPLASRRAALLGALVVLAGCTTEFALPGPKVTAPEQEADSFVMEDGTRLPYRAWLPEGRDPVLEPPWAVVLALHGMNDSRDAWEIPAPAFTDAGIAVFAPDQRGFGATAQRGFWPGAQALADDATAMAKLLRARYPRARLILLGESMGAAVLILAATSPNPPPADGYVLVAPAVWGRVQMNPLMRSSLWIASNMLPGVSVTGRGAGKVASDNRDALIQLGRNKLTIRETRFDAVGGLVDLMDAALAAVPKFRAPALMLYGGKDEMIPPRATRATWQSLPPGPRRAYYPAGYHLLLRDLERATPIADIIAWIRRPDTPLPAEAAAAGFLAESG
jgi:acylglycerol lipase